jgi:glycosyltransferase involved in cell wall biosynthesis
MSDERMGELRTGMRILYLDPYHGGSHAASARGYSAQSRHHLHVLTLPIEGGWRWRMRGAAVTFARMVREQEVAPDLIFTTDMLDLATFRALTRDLYPPSIPAVVYFFENQLTYPLPAGRKRDFAFAWTNYTSAMTADRIFFNSAFHRRWFLDALPELLGRYHDFHELDSIHTLRARSYVLNTGIDLQRLQLPDATQVRADDTPPVILWLSRWDYDKQPQVFFDALAALEDRGMEFRLIVAGEAIDPNAAEFVAARERWAGRLVHWGYPADMAEYRRLLHQADIVVSTALQETLGIGILEALYCGCIPIVPNRLVYPDLLPVRYHADCLYTTFADLVERLQQAVLHCAELRQYDWRAIAAPYDWSVVAPRYDDALEGVLDGKRETEDRIPAYSHV